MTKKISRRDFIKIAGILTLSTITGGVGVVSYLNFVFDSDFIDISHVNIKLSRLSPQFSGYRIVQIADLHMGAWMNAERLRRVISLVREQQPDMVVITGDFFSGPVWDENLDNAAEELVAELSPLTKEYPVLGVLGNHDYWSDSNKCREALKRCNLVELENDVYSLERDGEFLHIAGVDDIWYGHDDLDQVLSKLPETGSAILLAHEPDFADISAEADRFDLQLSGHSHGGQIVVPLIGSPWLPRLARKYPSGLYKVKEMWQYTNRGVGMADINVRYNCPPEITVFTLDVV